MLIRTKIETDERLLEFAEVYANNPLHQIPIEKLHKELTSLMETRISRTLKERHRSKTYSQDLTKSLLLDMSIRSRCSEIIASFLVPKRSLQETLASVKGYIMYRYSHELSQAHKNAADRKAFVDDILDGYTHHIERVEALEDHARLVIEDIDKTSHGYRHAIDLLKIVNRPEMI